MKIFNRHDRIIPAEKDALGSILDSLSGPEDALWPRETWPPMVLDPGLKVGAAGGHGPVRYRVSDYTPGRRAVFQFDRAGLMAGINGRHYFEVVPRRGHVIIRHDLEGDCDLGMWLKWTFFVRPLHNTVIEDAFDKVESRFSRTVVKRSQWGPYIRFLRRLIARRRQRLEAAK